MRLLWIVFVCVLKCSAMTRNELEEFSDFLFQTSQLDLNVKKGGRPDDDLFDEDEEISDHAWEESGKFEGDLILNDRQRRLIVENVEGLSRNGLTDSTKRWPDNELIYFIQREHFNSDQVQSIERGIEDLAGASCIKFRPYKKGDRDAVVIQGSRRGCFAQVGYQGGFQVLNLSGRHPAGRGCFRHGTVVHELLHTLGFYHMQSSPDRDDYIDVLWENILQPARHNFRKYNSFTVSDFGVGYDYDSVLHYSRRAFSSNGKDTLVPKQRGSSIGQRIGLSDKDTQKLNKMYCDADSNNFEADESSQKPKNKNKKKKPKNQPFDGHGIGYHQGKTVVIKLPTSEDIKLPDVSTIDSFNYFSNTPQTVPSPQAEVSLHGGVDYPYHPLVQSTEYKMKEKKPDDEAIVLLNMETPQDDEIASIEERNKEIAHWGSPYSTQEQTKPPDQTDELLADAYEKLVKNVRQKMYPESKDFVFKINKDYSEFYQPSQYKGSDNIKDFDERYGSRNNVPPHIQARKPIRIDEDERERIIKSPRPHSSMEYGGRMSLLIRKPYSSYEQTETPKYATLEYLKDRQNYSHLYAPRTNNKQMHHGPHPLFRAESPLTDDAWYKKDFSHNPAKYNPRSYTGYEMMEHKSNEPAPHPTSDGYDESSNSPEKSQSYISDEYDDSTESPRNSQAYSSSEFDDENTKPQKSQAYSLFGAPVPISSSWYKPSYANPEETLPYSEVSASHEDS